MIKQIRINALFILLYAAALVIVMFPIMYNGYNGRIVSAGLQSCDFTGASWFSWHIQVVRKNPSRYDNLRYAEGLFYPYPGINHGFLNNFQAVLYSFVIRYDNFVFSWNLLLILLMAFNFTAAFITVSYILKNRWLGLSGALVFCSNPVFYLQIYLGRIEIIPLGYVLLAVYYIFKTYETNKTRHVILGGLWTGLAGLSIYFYMYYVLFFASAYFIWLLVKNCGRADIGRMIKILLAVTVIGLSVIAPYIVVDHKMIVYEGIEDRAFAITKSLPNFMSPRAVLGAQNPFRPAYIFLIFIVLGMVFIRKIKKDDTVFWLIMTAVYAFFSLGNFIRVSGCDIPMPFYFMRKMVPFMPRDLYAERYTFMVYFTGSVYSLMLIRTALEKTKRKNLKIPAVLLTVTLILFDACILSGDYIRLSAGGYAPYIHPFYREIRAEGEGALINLPFLYSINSAYYQIWHHRPVMNWIGKQKGKSTFRPEFVGYIKNNYFLQGLLYANFSAAQERFIQAHKDKIIDGITQLRGSGFKYLVYQKEFLGYSPYEGSVRYFVNDSILDEFNKITSGQEPAWIYDRDFLYARYKSYIEVFAGHPYIEKDGLLVYKLR